jgi:N-acetylneuraminic acid mutarotase
MTRYRNTAFVLSVFCAIGLSSQGLAQSAQNRSDPHPPTAGRWQSEAGMPDAATLPAAGEINGIIYIAGGIDSGGPTAALQAYNPATNSWEALTSIPETLYEGDGTGTINSKLYVAGGWNGSLPTDTLYVYDPRSNSWTTKASMSHLSACGVTGVIDTKLYVTTACDGHSGYRQDLDVFDPAIDSWEGLSHSMVAHSQPAGAVINGKLYVAGGQNGRGVTKVTEVYDPVTNGWTRLRNMPTAVVNPASVGLDGKLWVFGGFDGTNILSIVQI